MNYFETYQSWLNASWLDEASREELRALSDPKEIEDRFYKDLEFGTGGMRGVMGIGTNRLNRWTLGRATLGLAGYLKAACPDWIRGVVIAYDSRNHSAEFALETAKVLCACGIPVKLFRELEPTPVLSFAVKALGAVAGVVITASHNPREYNGYKVYDRHGCQMVPRDVAELVRYIDQVGDFGAIPVTGDESLLTWIDQEVVEQFIEAASRQSRLKGGVDDLRVVYTPVHGSGNKPVRRILERCGFSDVHVVPEQTLPDGNFSTVKSPNPEERGALDLGISLAHSLKADLVIGTDPDCDRVGLAVRHGGEFVLLTGNQIGALMADFILTVDAAELNERSTLIKTIVTGELGASIARARGVNVEETLTGFKYIGEKITEYAETGEREFLMGYEESYGYLVGTHAQDKDAVVASLLICEMAAWHKKQGRTLVDALKELYQTYGFYLDALDSCTLKGKDGAKRICSMMETARTEGKELMPGVAEVLDYSLGIGGLPRENVLKFCLNDGSWFAIRPSGTEPKIKVYYSVCGGGPDEAAEKLNVCRRMLEKKLGLAFHL